MARVSRRVIKEHQKGVCRGKKSENINNCALYVRISVDDKSDSVFNQLEFLKKYIREKGWSIYKEYVDIGKSGTNFRRSGYEQMLTDAKEGRFNTLIVKDLSRLGRNYIETGECVEKVLPLLKVRFVAILDNYDSEEERSGNLIFNYMMKNLVNEMYAYDISKKVSSSIKMKQKGNRPYQTSVVPYGYKKSSSSKYIYDIDEKVAWIVRKIYDMYEDGCSITNITNWLCEKKINIPKVYRNTGKVCYANKLDKIGDVTDNVLDNTIEKYVVDECYENICMDNQYKEWSKSTVYRILNNKIYKGILEVNKTTTHFYNGKKKNSIEERIYFQDAVEAIIKCNQ